MSAFDTIGHVDPDTGRWKGVPEPDVIQEMEAAGQQNLVESDLLPRRILGATEQDVEALGIVLGDPVDDHFRRVVLPAGWTRKPAPDHSMWSYVYDERGRERIAVFFKAAPYDYNAHMRI